MSDTRPLQFSLRDLLALVAVAALLLSLLVPAIRYARESSRRHECANNLKQTMLGIHNYHDIHRGFPFSRVLNPQGLPMHSWRLCIYAFVEKNMVYDQYNFDESWDSAGNRLLHTYSTPVYRCPSDSPRVAVANTNYLVATGPETAWPDGKALRFADINDGTSLTLAVAEVADSGIHWLEPKDLSAADLPRAINSKDALGIGSGHPGGANLAMVDGAVYFFGNDTASDVIAAILTRAGHEEVTFPVDPQ